MRIAMIGQKGMPAIYGGVEQHVHELSVGLVRHGYHVTVYARAWYTGGNDAPVEGVTIRHIPTIKSKYFDTIIHTLLSTFHALWQGYDVMHYHGVGPSLLSFIPRLLRPKTRVIVTFHSIDRYHQKWGWLARAVLKIGEWTATTFPHKTIAISRGIEQYCLNEFQKHLTYIPYGVLPAAGCPKDELIRRYDLTSKQYIAVVSRLLPHKGIHLLISAFKRLKDAYPNDKTVQNLHLAVVGGSVYTDAYVESLHQMAAGRNDSVFTGFLSGETLGALYSHAIAVVHPSFNEGLPITVLKAMAYGTPVILSSIPEHRELVKDAACFFRSNDEESLMETLYRFLHLTKEERERIVKENSARLDSEYNWDRLIPRIIEVYNRPTGETKIPLNSPA